MANRFHRAARDGYLNVLKEATKRDCNQQDDDGITPTLWAAYEGNLEALRLLVGRGGNPEKSDYYGNTALHYASVKGHLQCVSFLINFGSNIWSLDNESHTAKDLAAINNKNEILKYLDAKEHELLNEDSKKAKKLQEKAKKEVDKRIKEFERLQRKTAKKRKEESAKLQKEIDKMNVDNHNNGNPKKTIFTTVTKNPLLFIARNKKENQCLHSNFSIPPKFSELTQSLNNKRTLSVIQRKILNKKFVQDPKYSASFKVRLISDNNKQSMRSLSGLQRDPDILFVPNGSLSSSGSHSPIEAISKRGKIADVFDTNEKFDDQRFLYRTKSVPEFADYNGSLFDRPGFGSVSFRNSFCSTLRGLPGGSLGSSENSYEEIEKIISWQGKSCDNVLWEENDSFELQNVESNPLYLFLSANGVQTYINIFAKEEVDLDALMLLSDKDLQTMKIPLGPRRKLLKAIEDRRRSLETPGKVKDARL